MGSAAGSTEALGVLGIQCLEHLVGLLLAQQTDHQGARRRGELLGQRRLQRVRAGDVVRAVEQHERLVADDLEPAG